ncbi:phosphopantetheine-binding protein [Streptomyces muensis]|uniref:Phosphopantetheine-binding protein n=1 Tax=Streptomyces muensis TaxID=1077944 RepID=A0A9X1PX17_STRM4|nr:phosphopantetheine-binding protein [Streptomyces muensis]MCF1593804.1 phosphopantetheine-binding protein [Streptomyces muensis]
MVTETDSDIRGTIEEAWYAALGAQAADNEGNFFALGGTSLSAVEFMTRVESRLEIDFPLELLFRKRALPAIIEECTCRYRDLHS